MGVHSKPCTQLPPSHLRTAAVAAVAAATLLAHGATAGPAGGDAFLNPTAAGWAAAEQPAAAAVLADVLALAADDDVDAPAELLAAAGAAERRAAAGESPLDAKVTEALTYMLKRNAIAPKSPLPVGCPEFLGSAAKVEEKVGAECDSLLAVTDGSCDAKGAAAAAVAAEAFGAAYGMYVPGFDAGAWSTFTADNARESAPAEWTAVDQMGEVVALGRAKKAAPKDCLVPQASTRPPISSQLRNTFGMLLGIYKTVAADPLPAACPEFLKTAEGIALKVQEAKQTLVAAGDAHVVTLFNETVGPFLRSIPFDADYLLRFIGSHPRDKAATSAVAKLAYDGVDNMTETLALRQVKKVDAGPKQCLAGPKHAPPVVSAELAKSLAYLQYRYALRPMLPLRPWCPAFIGSAEGVAAEVRRVVETNLTAGGTKPLLAADAFGRMFAGWMPMMNVNMTYFTAVLESHPRHSTQHNAAVARGWVALDNMTDVTARKIVLDATPKGCFAGARKATIPASPELLGLLEYLKGATAFAPVANVPAGCPTFMRTTSGVAVQREEVATLVRGKGGAVAEEFAEAFPKWAAKAGLNATYFVGFIQSHPRPAARRSGVGAPKSNRYIVSAYAALDLMVAVMTEHGLRASVPAADAGRCVAAAGSTREQLRAVLMPGLSAAAFRETLMKRLDLAGDAVRVTAAGGARRAAGSLEVDVLLTGADAGPAAAVLRGMTSTTLEAELGVRELSVATGGGGGGGGGARAGSGTGSGKPGLSAGVIVGIVAAVVVVVGAAAAGSAFAAYKIRSARGRGAVEHEPHHAGSGSEMRSGAMSVSAGAPTAAIQEKHIV